MSPEVIKSGGVGGGSEGSAVTTPGVGGDGRDVQEKLLAWGRVGEGRQGRCGQGKLSPICSLCLEGQIPDPAVL